ncbi:chemotaxis-specific protein-glutamate methyltransferase CheB [Sphingomonas sp. MMS24-J13]|uniref:chemotaxis-specific protein-glutamate methyltransferase CheB n=1 Tax=Sphingomonas sp. MMS24-J13 TaxID=3238686 RepID=UPI0038514BB0
MASVLSMDFRERDDSPIRVLIVDDSVVARTVLARMLDDRADFEVAGLAGSAAAALAMLTSMQVDIILLDLDMPQMNGIAALPALIERGRGARVLVVSSACAEGASSTLAALSQGAADTLLKPGVTSFAGRFADELCDRLCRIARSIGPVQTISPNLAERPARVSQRLDCLAIGASTGGVHALSEFFGALAADFAAPILVTQHLPPPFMPHFADQLREMTGRPARVAAPGMLPNPGEILLAPGDAHLTLARTGSVIHVRLERSAVPSGCRPSVDPMLASIGRLFGAGALGVVLSGMGRDGANGAEHLVAAGGAMLVQDAASSVVWGMPGVIANAGLAQMVAPPAELARRVSSWGQAGISRWM